MTKTAAFYFVLPLCILGAAAFAYADDPNIPQFIQNCKNALAHKSISMKISINVEAEGPNIHELTRSYQRHFNFRCDANNAEWAGQHLIFDKEGNVDTRNSSVIKKILADHRFMELKSKLEGPPRGVIVSKDYQKWHSGLLEDPESGGPLLGRMYGSNHKSILDLIEYCPAPKLRDSRETVSGVSCYVLEGVSEYGKVTVWVSPEKKYALLKWSVIKTGDDLFNSEPVSNSNLRITNWVAEFVVTELKEIDGSFLPAQAVLTHTITFADGSVDFSKHSYTVTDIDLNSAIAFDVNLPEGTRMYVMEEPGIRYIWRNGEIVPDMKGLSFEDIDRMVEDSNSR